MAERRPRAKDLARIAEAVRACTRCRLHVHRTRAVPGEGPLDAELFFIGEAPGRAEDAAGRPFAGSAGKVLTAALAAAGIRRESVFITNVVKCRPPGNRAPREDEAAACRPYLWGQIAAVRPKLIVTLGATALRAVVDPRAELRMARGKVFLAGRIPVVPTYHPAAILYNRRLEGALRRDLRKAGQLARRGQVARRKARRSERPRDGVRGHRPLRTTAETRGPSRGAKHSARPRG